MAPQAQKKESPGKKNRGKKNIHIKGGKRARREKRETGAWKGHHAKG